ncbi:TVP38/TMEM64 family protein [Natrinema ejinorense]|uniref:TVP38/TMEM64 family protein n=1 Tax=Natrinema ejinorense TaxID=373386 RepID=A0A2A5QWD0_9EURY|nr:VTT domain-containing protein [Natrinema ejinorense]PCR91125.1 TVP38/TMEM64 family protein [Natrinema ejinorense]
MPASSVRMRALAGVVVASGAVAAGLLVSPSTIVGTVDSLVADPVRFGLLVAGLYLVRPLLAWPTTPLAVVAGYGFGVAIGVPIALAGVVVTVLPVFLAIRWATTQRARGGPSDRPERDGDGGGLLDRTSAVVARYYDTAGPLRGVTASRLAPIPSDVATGAAAVSGVELRHLVVGTVLGELPWTIAAVTVGASMATITSSGVGELGLTFSIACVGAAVVLLAGPVYRTLRATNRTPAEESSRSTDG